MACLLVITPSALLCFALQAALEAKKKSSSAGSLTYEQSAEVPLSDELCGSLRQLRPKGRPLGERLR